MLYCITLLYYIIIHILLLYILLLYYYILSYTLLIFCSSSQYLLSFSSSSPPFPSNIPLPHLLFPPHSFYTCRYLDILIYILYRSFQYSQSQNPTPHVLSEVNVEWCSFNVCVLVCVSCWCSVYVWWFELLTYGVILYIIIYYYIISYLILYSTLLSFPFL